jgi:hypothetical protein
MDFNRPSADKAVSVQHRVIKKNLAICAIAMASTSIAMVMAVLLTYLCGGLPMMSNFSAQFYRLLVQVSFDVKINQLCVHAVTTVWVPIWVRKNMVWHSASVGFKTAESTIDEKVLLV